FRAELLTNMHELLGHLHTKALQSMMAKLFYWGKIDEEARHTVKSCQVCLANKVQPGPCPGTITQLEAREPFDVVSIDTVGGFSGFGSAKRYWHIAIDHHTRYVWAVASSRQAYTDFTNLMSKVLEDGTPKLILTDQYPALTSSTFRSYLEGKGIELAHIPPNSAHSNGRVERVNLTLTDNLRSCYNDAQNKIKNW